MATGRIQGRDGPSAGGRALTDERRELLRIDDSLLLEYRLEGEPDGPGAPGSGPSAEEAVAAFIGKPTAELLARAEGGPAAALLVPWMVKLDWALEAVLRALARIHPDAVRLPSLSDVNLSGGGVRFRAARPFRPGERLALRFVLPPFIPIQARGEVVRTVPIRGQAGCYEVGTRFTEIAPDDRERVIRHILQRQAEQLRARKSRDG